MKLKTFFKRSVCIAVIGATLLMTSACMGAEGGGESESYLGTDIGNELGNGATSNSTNPNNSSMGSGKKIEIST